MTREDKELLLTDLCGRLPYGVICRFTDTFDGCEVDNVLHPDDMTDMFRHRSHCDSRIDVKPYLRPMSSMTEEEKEQMRDLWIDADTKTHATRLIDFYNKYNFDYRGLIPKDLALSTEIYNPYKD